MKTLLLAMTCATVGCTERPKIGPAPVKATSAPAPTPPSSQSDAFPLEVRDDAGRRVRFAAPPRRVLSLAPSNTELLFALGAGDRLVGRTTQCDYPPAATKTPAIGSLFPPDYERITATRPDMVLMASGNDDVRQRLEARGMVVLVIQPKRVPQVADALRLLGRALGRSAAARPVIERFERDLAAAKRLGTVGPVRVYYEVWPSPLTAAGPTSFVGDLVVLAGGTNVVDSTDAWPRLSAERVIVADPEVIVVAREQDRVALLAGERSGWSGITAVERGHVFVPPDPNLLVRPGPRLAEGVRWLRARFAEAQN